MRLALRGTLLLLSPSIFSPSPLGRGRRKTCELCSALLQNELVTLQRLLDSCVCHKTKHHKWCWIAIVLGGRPSIKWDMASEWSLPPQAFAAAQRSGISEMFWENAKTWYNMWLHEIRHWFCWSIFFNSKRISFEEFGLYRKQKDTSCYTSYDYQMSEVCKGNWYVLDQLTFGEWEINVIFSAHGSDVRHFLSTQTLPCLCTHNTGPLLWTGGL